MTREGHDLAQHDTPEGVPGAALQEITPRQRRAIEALVTGSNLREAASYACVSLRTIHRWRERPVFRDALAARQASIYADAVAELRSASYEAVRTLRRIMEDEAAPTASRVRSALGLLAHCERMVATEETNARLGKLERLAGGDHRGADLWAA